MTTTVAISSQSIGTLTNKGENLTFATATMKKTKAADTTAFTVEVQVTNGAASYSQSTRVKVWYASTGFNHTYDVAPAILRQGARYVEVLSAQNAGQIRVRAGDLQTLNGQYLHAWVDVGNADMAVAQTLDINFLEVP